MLDQALSDEAMTKLALGKSMLKVTASGRRLAEVSSVTAITRLRGERPGKYRPPCTAPGCIQAPT